jgi:hypothetical protein
VVLHPNREGLQNWGGTGALRSCFVFERALLPLVARDPARAAGRPGGASRLYGAWGEGNGAAAEHEEVTSCSVLSIAAVASPHTGRRSFRTEAAHRSRCGPKCQIAHTRSVSAQTAVIQEDKGRESVGVPLSLNGESAQRRDRRPKQTAKWAAFGPQDSRDRRGRGPSDRSEEQDIDPLPTRGLGEGSQGPDSRRKTETNPRCVSLRQSDPCS